MTYRIGHWDLEQGSAGGRAASPPYPFDPAFDPAPGRLRLKLKDGPAKLWTAASAMAAREAVSSGLRLGEHHSISDLADQDLVRRCQAGSQAAFTEIVRRYQDRVHWLVRRMVSGPDDEDLTQEVFLRAYQAMPGLRSGATLRAWLFRIAHNLCVTELKKRGRRGEHVSLDEEGEESLHRELPQDVGRIEREAERREFEREVRGLLAKLPAAYREVLTLYYTDEATYEEIAEILAVPLGTVKTHLHRARLRLRALVLAEMDPSHLPGNEAQP
jgi:RNA polymerase sigma-70 factor (ECF subfamily)